MKPIRVLHILPDIDTGDGLTRVVTAWHQNLDKDIVQFDYLIFKESSNNLMDVITNCGGRVFLLPNPNKKLFAFLIAAYKFFKNHPYSIIHSHITQFNLFYFPLAKLFHVKHIILHSHATTYSGSKVKAMINRLMLWPVRCLISHRLAVSQESGEFLFGKKNFKIIFNGISPSSYFITPEEKEAEKKKLNLENCLIIGHVGRLSAEKNHIFLLEIFKAYRKINPQSKLLLIGQGPLKNMLREKVLVNGLEKYIMWKPNSSGKDLYAAMDILVFPSISEGFGLVPLEASASGIPVLVSDAIPRTIREIAHMETQALNSSAEEWAQHINYLLTQRRETKQFPKEFNINNICSIVQKYYLNECSV